jgi:hypothetical protein
VDRNRAGRDVTRAHRLERAASMGPRVHQYRAAYGSHGGCEAVKSDEEARPTYASTVIS